MRITKESVNKMRRSIEELPLNPGWARIYCIACGQNELVRPGQAQQAVERLDRHAKSHVHELAATLLSGGTEDLIETFTWAFRGKVS
jgi:hypothetical protein